jgi:hypothetical protein
VRGRRAGSARDEADGKRATRRGPGRHTQKMGRCGAQQENRGGQGVQVGAHEHKSLAGGLLCSAGTRSTRLDRVMLAGI